MVIQEGYMSCVYEKDSFANNTIGLKHVNLENGTVTPLYLDKPLSPKLRPKPSNDDLVRSA